MDGQFRLKRRRFACVRGTKRCVLRDGDGDVLVTALKLLALPQNLQAVGARDGNCSVVRVLQPGPLGIVEHKFSTEEIQEANATVKKAMDSWVRSVVLEKRSQVMKDFIK